jgi:hypothetical protein
VKAVTSGPSFGKAADVTVAITAAAAAVASALGWAAVAAVGGGVAAAGAEEVTGAGATGIGSGAVGGDSEEASVAPTRINRFRLCLSFTLRSKAAHLTNENESAAPDCALDPALAASSNQFNVEQQFLLSPVVITFV